ncbi:PREDICTED: uncharacterized protein LOC104709612 [Camelina sativa]|uniref:Uncharacterized protein LOC104709612 n=1 Tax=Camelina sativa TaxID=90675 RepID=A0ABM0TD17_CAMSA|nr:PREDICTED: uncharacterized protein LOC104709612 [Camelina sativa]
MANDAWAYRVLQEKYECIEALEKMMEKENEKNKLKDEEVASFMAEMRSKFPGLLIYVEQELPKVEHRMCARHIYGNLRRVYLGKELPKDLFWAVAKSFNIAEYERAILALKNFDKSVYDAVMMKNPRNCSRAFFTFASTCEDVSNNFSESYNNAINQAREMPLVEMLESLRRQCMIRNAMRKKKAMSHQGKFILKVAATITEEQKHMLYCHVFPCGNGHYEVTEHGQGFRVDMNAKTCACRRWSMTRIPCRHVLRIILKKKLKPEDFVVSDWYLTTSWVKQYSETLMGVNGMYFWENSRESRL